MPQRRIHPPRGPSGYLRHHQQFGIADPPVWRTDIPASQEHELGAAKVQHEFARKVNSQIARLDLTRAEVADRCGFSDETLNRYLRGASAIPLARMRQIAAVVALDITIKVHVIE